MVNRKRNFRRKNIKKRRFNKMKRRGMTPRLAAPSAGTMMVSFETEILSITTATRDYMTFAIGDHPQMGLNELGIGTTVDPKYGAVANIFQYIKPVAIQIKWMPYFTESVVIGAAQLKINPWTYAYDCENLIGAMATSATTSPGAFKRWLDEKEASSTRQITAPWTMYRKIYPRPRMESDDSPVKSIGRGFYSTKYAPAFGYYVFTSISNTLAEVSYGTFRVRWYCIAKSFGNIDPP